MENALPVRGLNAYALYALNTVHNIGNVQGRYCKDMATYVNVALIELNEQQLTINDYMHLVDGDRARLSHVNHILLDASLNASILLNDMFCL